LTSIISEDLATDFQNDEAFLGFALKNRFEKEEKTVGFPENITLIMIVLTK
jgi:hypothetical protein